jgi:RNA polymerase sigma-70 factor (ECF subfamily)
MSAVAASASRVRSMVDEHTRLVARTLRNGGVPRSDVDDEVQRTFMIVVNRLHDVRVGAERSFLFSVACKVAGHARRRLALRREVPEDRAPPFVELATPEEIAARQEVRRLLDGIVGRMDEPLRSVFALCELEGRHLPEIAANLQIPLGTASSRLRRARAQFRKLAIARDLHREVPK